MSVTVFEPHPSQIWGDVLARARRELPPTSYSMWFSEVRAGELANGVLELLAPSDFVRDRLARQYMDLIQETASSAAGTPLQIRFAIDASPQQPGPSEAPTPATERPPGSAAATSQRSQTLAAQDSALQPHAAQFTFDTFIAGSSNRFAHAAAMAVAEAPPSKAYNPLFIYGGTGLGKTHLLFALAHHMARLNPGLRTKYVTSERFLSEFLNAIRERRGYQFQRQYRDVNVLLVDDIQFLAKREETQTEFFHTFNAIRDNGGQIVIASDRPPAELSGMEDRLLSRFGGGLSVDVQPPDLETRIAILQLKAQRDGLIVPEDVLELIASRFDQNIRELEGALLRVAAFASLTHLPVDQELAERALKDLIPQSSGAEIPPLLIMDETAAYFSLSREDLSSKSRSRPLTTARHIAMYLMRESTGLSLVKIGEAFGNRDHSTVLHGVTKVEKLMRARGSTYRQVQDISRSIRSHVKAS